MDPSIVKFLEEDEDETMHSGADVDAFTAALNRDIEGNKSTSQPSDSNSAQLSQGSNYSSNQSVPHWNSSSQEKLTNRQVQQGMNRYQQQEPHMNRLQNPSQSQRVQNPPIQSQRVQNHQGGESQYQMPTQNPANLQQTSNQQTMSAQNPANMPKNPKQVSFGQLIPVIVPQLDKDKSMQLQTLYIKLRRNEVPKEGFLRLMKEIVGDQMIKMALYKLQTQATAAARNPQAGSSQPPQPNSQLHQRGNLSHADVSRQHPSSAPHPKADSSSVRAENNTHGSQDMGRELDKHVNQFNTKQEKEHSPYPPGLGKQQQQQQQQQFHFSKGSFPMYGNPGGNNPRPLSGTNATSSLKQQALDTHTRQGPGHQSIGGSQLGTSNQSMNTLDSGLRAVKDKAAEIQRMGFSSSMSTNPSSPVPRSITAQLNSQIPQVISSGGPGNDPKPPPKKPFIGQKKPLESLVSSPPQPSKKPKVTGALADQSIEQLNDVTAVSGVNLREEEEQLFSGSKEDSRVSEASQRVVKEEEERLILQKIPLQNKLAEIMSKCGVKNMNNDVERCLSLSVEERMRGLISSLIRLSKQRVDIEKSRHRTIVTSDVRKHIMAINQKAKEEWDKKQSETEKLQKPNELEGNDGVDGDKEKDDGRGKSLKQIPVNKDEDDKMRTTAANVAARAAVGGDDIFSKWQVMAEQARQKREGGSDVAFSSQQSKDISNKPSSSLSKISKENSETERQQNAAGGFRSNRKSVGNQTMPQTVVARFISVKDVISVLEREPQMSKSELLYRLYEKSSADFAK